jgi:adenine-specific DNA-methyltransferase
MDIFSFLYKDREKQEIISNISSIPSNYVGSKRRMLSSIWDIIHDNNIEFESVFDAFSGSSMVSLLFKLMNKKVICNDLLRSSALTAVCLLEMNDIILSQDEIDFLCNNVPERYDSFVLDNYKDKFFTEQECRFLDCYRQNIVQLFGDNYYSGSGIHSDNTIYSIDAYKASYALFSILHHINQNCFLGGRYYNGQTIAKMSHRISRQKNNGKQIFENNIKLDKFKSILKQGDAKVFNTDIIDLLSSKKITSDLIYLDPPYGGASSDYAMLYGFLEEYLHKDKLDNLNHIQLGRKRFSKAKGYQEQFETLLDLCQDFPTWIISYNESSYADLETITDTIKKHGRCNVIVKTVPIIYQYRKNKNVVDEEEFASNYYEEGYKFKDRGTEYLIMARK